jgi:hypothetical protein
MDRLPVIAILGKLHTGKDTVGQMLLEASPGAKTAFAFKLKQIVGEMYGLQEHDLYDDQGKETPTAFDCLRCPSCTSLECEVITMDRVKHGRCKLCGDIGDLNVFKSKWTPRTILQHIGTEGFRRVDPDVWVRYALEHARLLLIKGARYVTFTDCRFRSEAESVWKRGGEVWKIKRPSLDGTTRGIVGHASETEQDSIRDDECQAVIVNDGTLDDLRGKVNVQLDRFLTKY